MFDKIFKFLAERRERKNNDTREKYEAEEQARRELLLPLCDEQLVPILGHVACYYLLARGAHMADASEYRKELYTGLEIVRERVKKDGLNQHLVLEPIVREMAAIPSDDAGKGEKIARAVINATTEDSWRTLARPQRVGDGLSWAAQGLSPP